MRNKKHIHNEIRKLRILLNSKKLLALEEERAWYSMLTLQWALDNKKSIISPASLAAPRLFRLKDKS